MTLWNAEGLKPIRYLVWPLRSLKVRNPFLTLTWTWWPDLWWPGAEMFTQGVKFNCEQVLKKWRRCAPPFFRNPRKTGRGGHFFAPSSARVKLNILSSKNRFGKFLNFDPWRPQFWPETKNDRNWFRNDFSRAFERCPSFFSTATRSRDHGGLSNAPPRAGGGKSGGPAGRRVKGIIRVSKLQGIDSFYYLLDLPELANSNEVHKSLVRALFWKK